MLGYSNAMGETGRTALKLLSQTSGCLVASADNNAGRWQRTFGKGTLRETVGCAAFTCILKIFGERESGKDFVSVYC